MFFSPVPSLAATLVAEPSEEALLPTPRSSSGLSEGAKVHDVIIVGSDPAGCMATIYTARAGLNLPVFAGAISADGALMSTTEVENFPGFPEGIQGPELMDKIQGQAEKFGAEIRHEGVTAMNLSGGMKVPTLDDELLYARSVILTTDSEYRHTNVGGEDRLSGRGVSHCVTCDGFFSKDKALTVIGGGDSAMEETSSPTNFVLRVIVVHRHDTLRALKSMVDRAIANPRVELEWNAVVDEVLDDEAVRGLRLRSAVDESMREIGVDGVFITIGHLLHAGFLVEDVVLDEARYITVEKPSAYMSVEGVSTCGDTVDHGYRRAITAAGPSYRATFDAEHWLAALND